ncbi:leucine zipper putative tumor suppressor 2a [Denticeps clupeoides]|uniref:Leucine zipper putative tumor suppressor 2 homolog n=1 Tax=Denticeps clupeoides TaxID=299321 RepID=A0AAY4A0C9_9TELE|nr:leucine zipper putative tumor suppressor 2 homolog [Denticeps clupeoides]XP_028826232.1 leucine zipper putative tumor suppressor 2 homolog [Denticeps clupeoides]
MVAMALVQTLPVPTDHSKSISEVTPCHSISHSPAGTSSGAGTMGSVSSLISGHTTTYEERDCNRNSGKFTTKVCRPTAGTSCFRNQDSTLQRASSQEQLLTKDHHQPQHQLLPPSMPLQQVSNSVSKKSSSAFLHTFFPAGNGNYGYVCDEPVGNYMNYNLMSTCSPCSDCEDACNKTPMNGKIGGPPPKLIPVSGQLEMNMEKVVIRPTAFKPVVRKNRLSVQYLSPRPGDSLSESQCSLNLHLPDGGCSSGISSQASSFDKCNSYNGGRSTKGSQSCTMTDSGRNSLSSLPTYSTAGYSLALSDGPGMAMEVSCSSLSGGASHTHSDSGRSSSSKSTMGSLNGRGQFQSDNGSCGRSPTQVEAYEGVIKDLEEKLKDRELELQQMRENLDENEEAICQLYEEKQKRCEQELEELRQSYASRMKQATQKAQRGQQLLQLQLFQLQQEKKKMQEDFSQLLHEREMLEKRCASIEQEQLHLGPRLEETKWEVCQKSGEISLLKQQLKEVQADLIQKSGELVSLRSHLQDVCGELQVSQTRSQEANATARMRTLELEVCENELQRRKSEAELLRQKVARHEDDSSWLREALAAAPSRHNHYEQPQYQNSGSVKGQCTSLPVKTLSHGRGSVGHSPSQLREIGVDDQQLAAYESDEAKAHRQSQNHGQSPSLTVQSLTQEVERLKSELILERRCSEGQLEAFEDERRVWQEEKDKVIRYQKQLQQNYIHMYRRNHELESVMREISLGLESRDLEFEMHATSEIHFEEITATEI